MTFEQDFSKDNEDLYNIIQSIDNASKISLKDIEN